MHGRTSLLFALLTLTTVSCSDLPPAADVPAPKHNAGEAFDPANTGTIEGQVTWRGPEPDVPPFLVFASPDLPAPDGKLITHQPNPFRPLIDHQTRGVADAVVYLRGVNPTQAAPWPHGPVRVEQRDRRMHVMQDSVTSRLGFVRCGDNFEAINRDPEYHALRGRGAAFFSLPLVDRDRPTKKRLDKAGIVELSNAAGYYWMQAHLLVVEHGYYARTDREGRFRLNQVPAGEYEAVCWLPSWVVAYKNRDPESGLISRATFAPAIERTASVAVQRGKQATLRYDIP